MADPFTKHQATLDAYVAFVQSQGDEGVTLSTFNWNGTDYACTFKRVKQSYLAAGGQVAEGYLILVVMESLPTPGPQVKDLIEFGGEQWRIQIIEEALGTNPKYTCFDPARGT